jgi:protein TonB
MNLALHTPAHISDRAVMIGIGVSVVLHLIVLFMFSPARQGPASSAGDQILRARLMPRSAIREQIPLPVPEQRQEPPRRVEPPRPIPPVVNRPPVPTLTTPAPATAPRVAAAPPSQPPAPATPPAAAPQAAPPPAAVAPAPPPAAAALGNQERASIDNSRASPSADDGSIQQFRQDILIATRRYKRYPAQAMEKGWQGRVEIRLVIGSNGMTQSYVIKTSSGFQLLDDTALDMVKKGRPLVQVPPSLRGREFTVDVPVVFDLRQG